jgi:hypothetical protein
VESHLNQKKHFAMPRQKTRESRTIIFIVSCRAGSISILRQNTALRDIPGLLGLARSERPQFLLIKLISSSDQIQRSNHNRSTTCIIFVLSRSMTPSTISSRMENSGAIDISKPTTAGKEIRPCLPPLASSLTSLGPVTVKNLSSRDLSDVMTSTVASDFSEYEEEDQDIFPGQVQGAHTISDQWDCEDCCSSSYGEYDTSDDDYFIFLSDAPTRNSLLDETRTSPKRREMLIDDFERKILERRLNVLDDRLCAESTTDEEYGEEDYEIPPRHTSTRSCLLDEASRNPRKLELLMDDFEWRNQDKVLIHLGDGEIVASDVEDNEDSSCSQTEDEALYEYYAMCKRSTSS